LLVQEIFPPNEWWAFHSILFKALKHFGKLQGFHPILKHSTICCNR
jgi:hypothetical protein